MASNKENVIREKRTNLATTKNLMGPAGKLGTIVKAFGVPITRQGTGGYDAGYMDDPYDDDVTTEYATTLSGQNGPVASRDELPESGDDYLHDEGLLFDGLSRGMHLEIKNWHEANEIVVGYKGRTVYHEQAGELFAYAPSPEWEDLIDKLHKAAKDKLKKIRPQLEEEVEAAVERKKETFWERMRTRWGV